MSLTTCMVSHTAPSAIRSLTWSHSLKPFLNLYGSSLFSCNDKALKVLRAGFGKQSSCWACSKKDQDQVSSRSYMHNGHHVQKTHLCFISILGSIIFKHSNFTFTLFSITEYLKLNWVRRVYINDVCRTTQNPPPPLRVNLQKFIFARYKESKYNITVCRWNQQNKINILQKSLIHIEKETTRLHLKQQKNGSDHYFCINVIRVQFPTTSKFKLYFCL